MVDGGVRHALVLGWVVPFVDYLRRLTRAGGDVFAGGFGGGRHGGRSLRLGDGALGNGTLRAVLVCCPPLTPRAIIETDIVFADHRQDKG